MQRGYPARWKHVEDFAQLAGETRETKYDYSMEKMVPIIDKHCTAPVVEKASLLKRVIFNFLICNEDMHLKNFSLIIDEKGLIKLAPGYDFLNTTIAISNPQEEVALPLGGKKKNLTKNLLLEYYGKEKLKLPDQAIATIMRSIESKFSSWNAWLEKSFLPLDSKYAYKAVIRERARRLGMNIEALQ